MDGAGTGDDDIGLEGPTAPAVSVAGELAVRRLNKDLNPLDFLVVSLLPLLVPVFSLAPALAGPAASQVPRG